MAVSQRDTPKPLPLLLSMISEIAVSDPGMAHQALAGLARYQTAVRPQRRSRAHIVHRIGAAKTLLYRAHPHASSVAHCRDLVFFIPSLINPSHILDLAHDNSLVEYLCAAGYDVGLLDWGAPVISPDHPAGQDLADYVITVIVPMLQALDRPVHLIGYCLGGTLALAAAQRFAVRSLTLLATPWVFSAYDAAARSHIADLWHQHKPGFAALGCVPIEFFQTLFWGIDPATIVRKYAKLGADPAPNAASVAHFVALEDWANSGAPVSFAAAANLFDGLIGGDQTGNGTWTVGGDSISANAAPCPSYQFIPQRDRIVPPDTAYRGIAAHRLDSGHVSMVAGRRARDNLWPALLTWLISNSSNT